MSDFDLYDTYDTSMHADTYDAVWLDKAIKLIGDGTVNRLGKII